MMIHKVTKEIKNQEGSWKISGDRTFVGDIMTLDIDTRVESFWYQLAITREGEFKTETWNDETGVCARVLPVIPEKPEVTANKTLYRDNCLQLCLLANCDPKEKLEDDEFVTVRAIAFENNLALATIYTQNMTWALTQLHRLVGYEEVWEQI